MTSCRNDENGTYGCLKRIVGKLGNRQRLKALCSPPDRQQKEAREVRIAIGLTAALLFSIIAGIALCGIAEKFDFAVLYTGGSILRQGNASKVYDVSEQERVQEQFLHRKGLLIDPFPPFHALLFAPLAGISYRWAYVVWGGGNVLLWLFFQYCTRHRGLGPKLPFRHLMLCAFFFPIWVAVIQGQPSLLLLVLFLLVFVYLTNRHDGTAGFLLGLGLLKYPFVLPFAVIFLLRRKWRFMAGFVAAAALLGALSVIAVGPAGVWSYVRLILDMTRHPAAYEVNGRDMLTVTAFFSGLLGGRISTVWVNALAAVSSCCLIIFTACRWRQEERHRDSARSELMFAAALVTSLAAAPHLLPHDLTPMILAILLVTGTPQWTERSSARAILATAIGILYIPPLYPMLLHWELMYVFAPVLVAFVLATTALARKGADLCSAISDGSEQVAAT